MLKTKKNERRIALTQKYKDEKKETALKILIKMLVYIFCIFAKSTIAAVQKSLF